MPEPNDAELVDELERLENAARGGGLKEACEFRDRLYVESRRVLALASRGLEVEQGWMPIISDPTATRIIGFNGERVAEICWALTESGEHDWLDRNHWRFRPTHWMLLPAPPEKGRGE